MVENLILFATDEKRVDFDRKGRSLFSVLPCGENTQILSKHTPTGHLQFGVQFVQTLKSNVHAQL
jgi:hypothetical protein